MVFQTPAIRDYYGPIIRRRSVVIPNVITSGLPEYEYNADNRAIVTMARLEPQKNISMLIDAFAEFHRTHPDYTLRIYGQGSEEKELNNRIIGHGLTESAQILPFRNSLLTQR